MLDLYAVYIAICLLSLLFATEVTTEIKTIVNIFQRYISQYMMLPDANAKRRE